MRQMSIHVTNENVFGLKQNENKSTFPSRPVNAEPILSLGESCALKFVKWFLILVFSWNPSATTAKDSSTVGCTQNAFNRLGHQKSCDRARAIIALNDLFTLAFPTRFSRKILSANAPEAAIDCRMQISSFSEPRRLTEKVCGLPDMHAVQTNERLGRTKTKAGRMKFISDWNKFEHKIWNANDANILLHYNELAYCALSMWRAGMAACMSWAPFMYTGNYYLQYKMLKLFSAFLACLAILHFRSLHLFRSTGDICGNSCRVFRRRPGSHARLHRTRRGTARGEFWWFSFWMNAWAMKK